MKPPLGYNIFTQALEPGLACDFTLVAAEVALKFATAGQTILDVAGTPIAGTRTAARKFTRTSGTWYRCVTIDISTIVPAGAYTTFVVGETLTETTSTSTGVVLEVNSKQVTLGTLSAAFTGGKTLTGGTSGVTALGGTATHVIEDLTGKVVWSHASGTKTAGSWVIVTNNTALYLETHADLHATGTAIILCDSKELALSAMDIKYGV